MVYNAYIVVPLATFAVAQLSKFALAAFRGRLDFRYLYVSGGMPSVHSAIVTSLATTALLVDGAGSHLFGFSLVLALIVMYDSFGVRRAAGEQAAAINMIVDGLDRSRIRLEKPNAHVREIMGHQPEEVTFGAILGIVLGCLFNYDRLQAVGSFLESVPRSTENLAYAVVAGILIVGSIIARVIVGRRRSRAMSRFSSQLLVAAQSIGWLTVLASVLTYERASYLAWRLWVLVILTLGAVWFASLVSHWRSRLPEALQAEQEAARKGRWLNLGRRKRRA